MDERENIVELVDDETGETVVFEHLATLEHEGDMYIALMLPEDVESDDDEGEVIIMKIDQDEDGNECYVSVEDDELQEAVFEKFLALMEEADADDAE